MVFHLFPQKVNVILLDYLEIIEYDLFATYHIKAGSCQAKSGVLEIRFPIGLLCVMVN
jgi:hypothetical protein